MMVGKLFSLLTLLAGFGVLHNDLLPPYSTDFVVENHVLKEVNDKTANEIRIYSSSGVTSIDEHAFDGCSFTSIMVSNSVTTFAPTLTDGITLNLTNDKASYSFALPVNVVINEYACDEGFINYWNTYIRNNVDESICNVTRDQYTKVKNMYSVLSDYDKNVVNEVKDGTGTIKDSLKYLDGHFSSAPTQKTTKEISQTVMITLILVIASFGMTAIGIFYVLKDKKVIN